MDFTPVPVISKKKAQPISTPITLFGQKNIKFPGVKTIKRAQKIFPSLKRVVMLENSKHVQNTMDNNAIEKIGLQN
jgi:hypothetical protein